MSLWWLSHSSARYRPYVLCYDIETMIVARYIKSYKTIIGLGIFVAIIPLLGIPSWARDTLTYVAGLCVALGTFLLHRKPREISTIKESLTEAPTIGVVVSESEGTENK